MGRCRLSTDDDGDAYRHLHAESHRREMFWAGSTVARGVAGGIDCSLVPTTANAATHAAAAVTVQAAAGEYSP